MSTMVPFRVDWELFSPVIVPTMPIHLDSLLSWARVREADLAGNLDSFDIQHDLPLEKHETDSGWCFKASVVNFKFTGQVEQLHYIKRADIDEWAVNYMSGLFGKKKPYFDPARGATKAGSIQVLQRFASKASAFGVGDIDRVKVLLSQVDSLGKLRRRAKGAIRTFTVTEDQDGVAHWRKRNLPIGSEFANSDSHALSEQRLYAPYWSKDRHEVLAPV